MDEPEEDFGIVEFDPVKQCKVFVPEIVASQITYPSLPISDLAVRNRCNVVPGTTHAENWVDGIKGNTP